MMNGLLLALGLVILIKGAGFLVEGASVIASRFGFSPLTVGLTVVSEIPFSLSAALLLGFLANAHLFSEYPELSISHVDGIILLFFFLLFMLYCLQNLRNERKSSASSCIDWDNGAGVLFNRVRCFGSVFRGAVGR